MNGAYAVSYTHLDVYKRQDKVCRTVTGTLLVAAADITGLLAVLVLIPLLIQHMAAVGAEQHTLSLIHI